MTMRGPSGKIMVPTWAVTKVREMMTEMSGEHAVALVAQAVLLGENGFTLASTEEAVALDAMTFGPLMIMGYNHLAGQALAKLLSSLLAELRHEDHTIHDQARQLVIEAEADGSGESVAGDERAALILLVRNAANKLIRDFLDVQFTLAGIEVQKTDDPPDIFLAGVSQALGTWVTVANSPIKFEEGPRA